MPEFTLSSPDAESFAVRKLPLLARHYRREALNEIKIRVEWLKVFTSAQPNFEEARNQFFKNGSGCVRDLESHIELTRLARANEWLTRLFGSFYSLFLAEIHANVNSLPFRKSAAAQDAEKDAEKDAEIEEMRNGMIEVENLETPGSRDIIRSFLDAGHATVISGRRSALNSTYDKHTNVLCEMRYNF